MVFVINLPQFFRVMNKTKRNTSCGVWHLALPTYLHRFVLYMLICMTNWCITYLKRLFHSQPPEDLWEIECP